MTKEQKHIIKGCWSKYVGISFVSHSFYAQKNGEFHVEYIPDSILQCYIDPYFNDWSKSSVIDNKCYYPKMFEGINMPLMIGCRINGYWYNKDYKITKFDTISGLVFQRKECFIKKATNSWGGLGVVYFQSEKNTIETFEDVINRMPGDIVIQEAIVQHKTLSQLNPVSVNTIRIISFLDRKGNVKIYSSILRMGIKGAKVDNASSGGISVGIKEDGSLKSVAYTNTGIVYYEHPTSHCKFEDFTVPSYKSMCEMVEKIHPSFPYFRLISWDLAVGINEEPILIEANFANGEIDFHQLNNGPLFKDDTKMILNEVFKNN